MPCIFCDTTPETVTAVETLKDIKRYVMAVFDEGDMTNWDVAQRVYDIMQEVYRRRAQVNRAEVEHERQAQVISELQKTVEEYQLRAAPEVFLGSDRTGTGRMKRHQKPWNDERMFR